MLSNYVILLIEENSISQFTLFKNLEEMGFSRILTVKNQEEAVLCLNSHHIDLIFYHLSMADTIYGSDVLHQSFIERDIPVILQSTIPKEKLKKVINLQNFHDFLAKPYHYRDLEKIVYQWLDGQKKKVPEIG